MTELTPAEVRALAAAAGLRLDGADLTEVMHRLNAFIEVLGGLAGLDLTSAEPAPASPPDLPGGPDDADLVHRSAVELAGLIRARTISSLEAR